MLIDIDSGRSFLKELHSKHRYMRYFKNIVFILLLIFLSGCSTSGVEPWQRNILSQQDMQFGSTDLTATLGQHFYFSKEGSSGGEGFAGGGCGCN